MNKIITTALLVVGVTLSAVAGTKKVGTINGIDVYRIRTAGGFFCPPTTTIVAADPSRPGTIEVINGGVAPSIFQQAFTPVVEGAGLVGAAHMFRPPASQTNVEQSGGGASASSDASAKGGKGGDANAVNVNTSVNDNTNVNANVNDNTNVNANSASSTSNSSSKSKGPKNCKPGKGPKKPKSPKGPKN